jgi:hypothetical protein
MGSRKTKPLVITLDELPYQPSNGYQGMTSTDVTIRSLHRYLIPSSPAKNWARANLTTIYGVVKQNNGL